jgi:hypothetical protein
MITPYLGAGLSNEREMFSRWMMTDRKKPILFSKHNRYTHTVEHAFETTQYLAGLEVQVKDVAFFIQHNQVKMNNSQINNQYQQNGEDFAFASNAYGFATPTEDYSMTVIGARVYF